VSPFFTGSGARARHPARRDGSRRTAVVSAQAALSFVSTCLPEHAEPKPHKEEELVALMPDGQKKVVVSIYCRRLGARRACVVSRREVLIIRGESNVALGKHRASDEEERPGLNLLGPLGAERKKANGDALPELTVEHDLCVARSFFQKKQYSTPRTPAPDQWLVSKPDLKRVGDVGTRPCGSRNCSDYTPLWVRLDVHRRSLQRFNRGGRGEQPARGPSAGPARLARHDTKYVTRSKYVNGVREAISEHRSPSPFPSTCPPPPPLPSPTPARSLETTNIFAPFSAMDEAPAAQRPSASVRRRERRRRLVTFYPPATAPAPAADLAPPPGALPADDPFRLT
jgi:hypothetical protein